MASMKSVRGEAANKRGSLATLGILNQTVNVFGTHSATSRHSFLHCGYFILRRSKCEFQFVFSTPLKLEDSYTANCNSFFFLILRLCADWWWKLLKTKTLPRWIVRSHHLGRIHIRLKTAPQNQQEPERSFETSAPISTTYQPALSS